MEERDSISVFSWDGKVDGRLLSVWRIVWDELFQNMRKNFWKDGWDFRSI